MMLYFIQLNSRSHGRKLTPIRSSQHIEEATSLFRAGVLGCIRFILEDIVNSIAHLFDGFTEMDKSPSRLPKLQRQRKFQPDFLCKFSKLLLDSLGVSL